MPNLIPFSPPPGLDNDDTSFAASGRWAIGDNVRFYNGRAEPVGGWVTIAAMGAISAQCRAIFASVRGGSNEPGIAYGFATASVAPKLYIRDPASTSYATPLDVTPVGLSTATRNWSLGAFGTTLLAAPTNGTLYEQIGTSTATAVTAAPDNITCMIVTPQRQVLALGCNEEISTTFNGRCIRGCDLEDYNNWTTGAANNAFEHILEGGGNIVAGTVLGDYVVVWTTTSLWLGQFIGDPSQTYRFEKIDDNCGLISLKAFAILNQRLYWLGSDGLPRTWAVGELPQLVPFPIRKSVLLTALFTVGSKITATSISSFGEVRFYIPDNSIEGSSITYCPATGTWYQGVVGRSAACESALLLEINYQTPILTADASNNIIREETGHTGTGAVPYSWSIQSADFYLDSSNRRMMIRGIIQDLKASPNLAGISDVSLTLYVRDRPQSTPVIKGPYTLTAGSNKRDFRASGKIVSVKFSGGNGTFANIGKCLFDAVPTGER